MSKEEAVIMKIFSSYVEKIQLAIFEGSWEDLNDTLKQRQAKLEIIFSELSSSGKDDILLFLIKKIQKEDGISLQLIKTKKLELEKQYLSLKQGRKSLKAYQS